MVPDTGLHKLNTGKQIGLGLAALGRPGYINLGHQQDLGEDISVEIMRAGAFKVLDAAYRAGVRYFDAARSYGKAEDFLADWIRTKAISPSELIIGSKWGYVYTADWNRNAEVHEKKDHSLSNLERQWQESSSNLGSNLDLYQIHSATFGSGVLENHEVLERLFRIKESGVSIGFSTSGEAQSDVIRKAMKIHIEGKKLFNSVQATWNILEPSTGPVLSEAHAAGMIVIVKEALANGRLTTRNQDREFKSRKKVLEAEAHRQGCGIDALALACALAQPWADFVLSGAATVAQVESNLDANRVTLAEGYFASIKTMREDPKEYWHKRSQLPWN
jgi:aryl-alcohol dehydrogenase-like predicted oxidoreductase